LERSWSLLSHYHRFPNRRQSRLMILAVTSPRQRRSRTPKQRPFLLGGLGGVLSILKPSASRTWPSGVRRDRQASVPGRHRLLEMPRYRLALRRQFCTTCPLEPCCLQRLSLAPPIAIRRSKPASVIWPNNYVNSLPLVRHVVGTANGGAVRSLPLLVVDD